MQYIYLLLREAVVKVAGLNHKVLNLHPVGCQLKCFPFSLSSSAMIYPLLEMSTVVKFTTSAYHDLLRLTMRGKGCVNKDVRIEAPYMG